MNHVALLDESTINKIAAGEVVDRPASAIKELVENSLDAGATRIEVEITAGGTSLMRVTDNGCGMTESDAKMSVKRHATSKIRKVSDLPDISTLGFRGEALATIASVSKFTLVTRPESAELATQLTITGGNEPKCEEIGAGTGTTVKVEDLFFNTPARKKFLKTNHTEGGRINDFVVKLALSRPEVAFRFINNKKQTLATPGNSNLLDCFGSIYGPSAAENMLELNYTEHEPIMNQTLTVSGYVSKPTLLKSSRAWQTLLVNGRVVQSAALARAIDNAYKAMIPQSGFPMAVIVISVNPHEVDVNVHPQKTEVRFADEGKIFRAVYKAVLEALRPAVESVVGSAETATDNLAQIAVSAPASNYKPMEMPLPVMSELPLRKKRPEEKNTNAPAYEIVYDEPKTDETTETPTNEHNSATTHLYPIGQVSNCYIIAKDAAGMYIVDQHAAHERILYDRLTSLATQIPSQPLLIHIMIPMLPTEIELIEANANLFAELGFGLSRAGEQEMRLTEIPTDVPLNEAANIIREIMTNLREMHEVSAGEIRHAIIAVTACRSAVKAGDELNFAQMERLLSELAVTAKPYTCPHGRPTILKFSTADLDKMFKRTGF